MTVVLAVFQSFAIAIALDKGSGRACRSCLTRGPGFILMTVLTLTTGTAFIMWLGEQITDRGIGNGMSLLIFAGIVVGFPAASPIWSRKLVPRLLALLRFRRLFCWLWR